MSAQTQATEIPAAEFVKALHTLLDETFDNVQGLYLDKGTSMFETLTGISPAEASVPVSGKCATLAAQVKHVAFYFDVLERSSDYVLGGAIAMIAHTAYHLGEIRQALCTIRQ